MRRRSADMHARGSAVVDAGWLQGRGKNKCRPFLLPIRANAVGKAFSTSLLHRWRTRLLPECCETYCVLCMTRFYMGARCVCEHMCEEKNDAFLIAIFLFLQFFKKIKNYQG